MLIRRRNPESDRAGVIDSLIMTLGLALLSWVALIAPYLHDETMTLTGKLVSVAYPLGDILLLAAAIRLAVDTGKRLPAFYLLASAHRGAARHRLRLRRGDAARRLSRPGHPRHRLDQLLPAVGRRGSAPVDAPARAAGARPRPAPDLAAPHPAHRRVAHRADRRGDAGAAPRQPRPARHHRRLGGALRPRRAAHGRPRAPAGALRRPRAHAERGRRVAGGRHRPRGDLPRRPDGRARALRRGSRRSPVSGRGGQAHASSPPTGASSSPATRG